jgi:RIO kinase 1
MPQDQALPDAVTAFIEEGWITEVLFRVKSGKEATVYCCAADPIREVEYYALKVYTPPDQRSFRNAAVYQENRFDRSNRQGRAMHNKSAKGREMLANRWPSAEYATLETLHRAGCDVAAPIALGSGSLLIEFIASDEDPGQPAPQLMKVRFEADEATAMYAQALVSIEEMLASHVVHGDLSAYNILYAGGRLRVIDFPQSIDARHNSNAQMLLARDVANVSSFFARQGCVTDPVATSAALWKRYSHAQL